MMRSCLSNVVVVQSRGSNSVYMRYMHYIIITLDILSTSPKLPCPRNMLTLGAVCPPSQWPVRLSASAHHLMVPRQQAGKPT